MRVFALVVVAGALVGAPGAGAQKGPALPEQNGAFEGVRGL